MRHSNSTPQQQGKHLFVLLPLLLLNLSAQAAQNGLPSLNNSGWLNDSTLTTAAPNPTPLEIAKGKGKSKGKSSQHAHHHAG